ncbi:uncharacterized protein ACNLHF_007304 isoform 1-T2 [Anomaloglossus baeobatrachus]|uniref:uncharacterized protein LOC142254690 n=1 Tax=Anomaloglossus baeobatrachus TaxID=238106 RepID=UPI003F4FB92D
MGAKLSKKKKGYCLGAGKDGESTETTEVEQKETETQLGQKDAAEPNGEKTPTDQTQNNGASEEQKAQVEKNKSKEAPSGKTTKDNITKDQKSEGKSSAEQKKVEEPKLEEQDQPENIKSSIASQETAPQGDKEEKSQPVEKPQTDQDKVKDPVAKEPTLEPKAVMSHESSEPKLQSQPVIEPSAPLQEELAKSVPDPETKVQVEKMEKEQTPVLAKDQVSEQATKEQTLVMDSVKEAETLPEKVEPLVSETVLVAPVMKEPVAEVVKTEPVHKVIEPEPTKPALPEAVPTIVLVKPEPVMESVESKLSEEPIAPVPEIKIVEPVANPVPVPCSEPEKLCETSQEIESLPEPLPSNEVPDSLVKVEEHVETLGKVDLVPESIEIQASVPAEQSSVEKVPDQDVTVADKGPSEQAVEEIHESKVQDTINTQPEVGDEEKQKEVKEEEKESVSSKEPTEQGSLEKEQDCEVALDTSKHEGDHEDTTDKNAEDDSEHHKKPVEELSNEPSAPLIVEKHGVSNGLPLKEEVKVHLENGCDKDLHELNGQGEGHEIAVCNE